MKKIFKTSIIIVLLLVVFGRNTITQLHADIDSKGVSDVTALRLAVINENVEMVKILLNKGADVNAQDKDGNTLLHLLNRENLEIAKLLIKHGFKINKKNNKGETPLFTIVRSGNKKLIEFLILSGADPFIKNNKGFSTYDIVKLSYPKVVNLLRRHNFEFTIIKKNIILSRFYQVKKLLEKKYLEKKLKVNSLDSNGLTLLHYAAMTPLLFDKYISFGMPMEGEVSSLFGWRRSPSGYGRDFHTGIDFVAPSGTIIRAAAPGVVAIAGWQGGYGNTVKIKHRLGFETLYAHCKILKVIKGEKVKKGEVIAQCGTTGNSRKNHLHYEVRLDGISLNPYPFIRYDSFIIRRRGMTRETVTEDYISIVKLLLSKGADPFILSKMDSESFPQGTTPMDIVKKSKNRVLIDLFLKTKTR